MQPRTIRIILAIFIAGLLGYYLGTTKVKLDWANYRPHIEVASKEPPASVSHIDFAPLWTVLQKIETSYYDKTKIDSQKILNGAISGMVESLEDPYTVYLPPAQNTDFKDGLAGKFEGIGAELGLKGKQIIIVAPLAGSPAEKAGVKPGDAIVKVNDQATFGWTIAQAVDKIRGEKGTEVVLTVASKDSTQTREVKIIRDTITVESVTSWVKPIKDIEGIKITDTIKPQVNNRIAYVRLSQFGDNTNDGWVRAANEIDLEIKKNDNVQGLILDLRNNPGGYLTDAVFIASEFIESGTIVMQEDASGERAKLNVSRRGILYDIPIIVLINKGSASASEIVAGALSDYERATLLGETSFGKGTIQQAEDLGEGAGLHVTIAKWLTPNGTWVHEKGITPDIQVAVDTKDQSHDLQLEKAIEELIK